MFRFLETNLSEKDLIIKLNDIINNPCDQYKELYIDLLKEYSLNNINTFNYNIYLDRFYEGKKLQIHTFFPGFDPIHFGIINCSYSNVKAQTYYNNLLKKLIILQ